MPHWTDKRWKGIVIDWPTIEGMDTVDYELKPLNQQQVAILLALLEYQKWPTRWTGLEMNKSELETYIADIEQRLMRNEGGGMATKDDIRDGMYEAMNMLAKQIVSGRTTNISVGEDGTVSDPSDTDVGSDLPEDDPTTPINEESTAKMGGCVSLSRAIESFLDKVDTYYGATNGTPATPVQDASVLIEASFPCDKTLMDAAIVAYYSYRNTNPRILFDVSQAMQLFLFCHGANEGAWNQWLVDQSGYAIGKFNTVHGLTEGLLPEFWSSYFNQGTDKPSTVYLEAGCVPSPREIMLLTVFNTNVTSQTGWKPNHRLKFTVTGVLTDPAGHKRDFWYYDANNAAPLFVPASMSMQLGTGITKPTINQVPFSATGSYIFTIDTPAASGSLVLNMAAGGVFNSPFTGAPITVTIDDLGEIFS